MTVREATSRDCVRAWVNEALNRLLDGEEPYSAVELLRSALRELDREPLESNSERNEGSNG